MDIRQKSAEIGLRLRRLQIRLGGLGLLVLVVLVLAAIELFSVTLPTLSANAEMQEQLEVLKAGLGKQVEITNEQDTTPAAQLATFQRFFPPMNNINQVLGAIYEAAEKEKLNLERGEYRLSEEAGLSVLRYQITLPVKAPGGDINRFVRRLLRDVPSLTLDSIAMQRQSVAEASIEAQIHLSVFLQGEH